MRERRYKKTGVIIPAAGSAVRMKSAVNKQFLMLSGMPVLARTLKAFTGRDDIDRIVVALNGDEFELFREKILSPYFSEEEKEKIKTVRGGKDRQESVFHALDAFGDFEADDILLIHDGARPLVSGKVIDGVIEGVNQAGAAVCALASKNTIKMVKDGRVVETLPRESLYEAQTPQGSRLSVFREAAQKAERSGISGTDDVSLIERIGLPVLVTDGDEKNIKITVPADLVFAEAVLQNTEKNSGGMI